jgi:hypothetical protein
MPFFLLVLQSPTRFSFHVFSCQLTGQRHRDHIHPCHVWLEAHKHAQFTCVHARFRLAAVNTCAHLFSRELTRRLTYAASMMIGDPDDDGPTKRRKKKLGLASGRAWVGGARPFVASPATRRARSGEWRKARGRRSRESELAAGGGRAGSR